MKKSLSSFDVTRLASSAWQKFLIQIVFGVVCATAMIALRSGLDTIAPTSGPFALIYPTVLISTLFGRQLAGLISYVICFIWAWWFVLDPIGTFALDDPSDPARVTINAASALIVVFLAETFRKAVQQGNDERDREIERRAILMEELDHRTKNNFAMVSSLLAVQKHDLESPEAIDALEQASMRVHMFAKAYENLSESSGEGYPVEMRTYLEDVIKRVRIGGFGDQVNISVTSPMCTLPRQTAVTIGLFVNEAVTNCAKYAFPNGRSGQIDVEFARDQSGWLLIITDNGLGSAAITRKKGGRGAVLMAALANQVDAQHQILTSPHGTRVEVRHSAGNPESQA